MWPWNMFYEKKGLSPPARLRSARSPIRRSFVLSLHPLPPLLAAALVGRRSCSILLGLAAAVAVRPPHPIPTLPNTDPVCSPVAPRVSGLLPQGGDLPSAGMGGPKPRVLGACGGFDFIHDLGARTHSCMTSHAGSQCV